MGYHRNKIEKGTIGKPSKIREEFEEFIDAHEQGNPVMELVELSDIIGAIELYASHQYNISLEELIVMKNATKSAFQDGDRQYKPQVWRCKRCKQMVDMENFKCGCTVSPSPWELVDES
jgi:hypothetical protein